jgi:uncharacterized sulfatase
VATTQQPNILVILSDQQRWDTLHCYGNPLAMTPNLDAMAAEGVRIEHAITPQPVCGPCRSCLQTGRYATETGCWENDRGLSPSEPTIAHLLADVGYEVGYLGKWHLASHGKQLNLRTKPVPPAYRGGYKDYWLASDILEFTSHAYDGHMFDADNARVEFPKDRYRVDAQTDFAIDYLNTRTGEQPFFLFLSFIEPHHQNDLKCFQGPKGSKERFKDAPVPQDLQALEGDWPESWADYLGCCASLDDNVGRIRAELDRLGLTENTLVVYASDHGCHFRTRNAEYKRSCHESSIRVPMILHGPGFTGGTTPRELVSLIDLPPTLLTAAGADVPPQMRGRPLQQLGAKDWSEETFTQISEEPAGRAIRTNRWKYAVHTPDGLNKPFSDTYQEAFLYDLNHDPHELHNLVADPTHAATRKDLCARLLQHMARIGEPACTIHLAPTS